MKKSGVTFDFESLIKGAAGAGGIVLTPTVHISKDGSLSFYCINEEETYHQFRMAKSGNKVGIELLETPKDNSYALRKSGTAFVGRISCLSDYLDLDFFLGTDFYSGNFPLYQQAENIWWFDLKEAHSKRKPLNLTTKDDHYKYHYIVSLLREDGKSFTIHLYSDYGYHKSSDILEFLWSGRLQKYILSTPQGFVVLSTKKQLSEFKFEVKKQK
ncbi:hypothetical protein ACRPK2_08670 [Lactococcus garvieae]|uniref:hypothetical protein n=1 Tax=Lactococcus garvieae TaxID=1363 RepID=UPI003D76BA0D